MTKRDSAPIGAPCWIELSTTDTDKSRAFYEGVFGWTSESAGEEFGGYINFSKDGVAVAGCMANDGSNGMTNFWLTYLSVDDAKATCDAAAANGGQVFMDGMDVGELGTMAVVADPGGAAIGTWKPGTFTGFGVLDEPGAPSWFELHTGAYDASVEFYRKVFGWDTHAMSDTPEFRYTTLGEGEGQLAAIMDASTFLPKGVPAHWSIYFGAADTDASLSRIVDLGGSIVMPAEDTPHGRLATAADPTGALFKLVQGT